MKPEPPEPRDPWKDAWEEFSAEPTQLEIPHHDVPERHFFGGAFPIPGLPLPPGAANAGNAPGPARSDHVHPGGPGIIRLTFNHPGNLAATESDFNWVGLDEIKPAAKYRLLAWGGSLVGSGAATIALRKNGSNILTQTFATPARFYIPGPTTPVDSIAFGSGAATTWDVWTTIISTAAGIGLTSIAFFKPV